MVAFILLELEEIEGGEATSHPCPSPQTWEVPSVFFPLLGIKLGTLHTLGKHSTTKLQRLPVPTILRGKGGFQNHRQSLGSLPWESLQAQARKGGLEGLLAPCAGEVQGLVCLH